MALTSLQVCMDSSEWLQGTIHDEAGMDSSSSPSGDMLTCPRPLMERRLRPPHDQALKCPRCDSTHTKFCYYNNYSLSQPRYFCKTCRRYWTKGGTLRNIPVGGGCRKNKKVSSKNKNSGDHQPHLPHLNTSGGGGGSSSGGHNQTDLQLSFPAEVQLSHLTGLLGHHGSPSFMEGKYSNNAMPFEFMDGSMRSHDFMGSVGDHFGMIGGGFSDQHHHGLMGHHGGSNFHNSFSNSPYGMSLDGNSGGGLGQYMDSVACQRLMLPYEVNEDQNNNNAIDVKPNTKLLSLEWQHQQQQDQGNNNNNNCSDSYGGLGGGYQHLNGLGSWSGLMNGYGSSTTNPLV